MFGGAGAPDPYLSDFRRLPALHIPHYPKRTFPRGFRYRVFPQVVVAIPIERVLDSQEKDVFLDREREKTDCGPVLLYVSEEEKKQLSCSIALAGRSKTRL